MFCGGCIERFLVDSHEVYAHIIPAAAEAVVEVVTSDAKVAIMTTPRFQCFVIFSLALNLIVPGPVGNPDGYGLNIILHKHWKIQRCNNSIYNSWDLF